MTDVLNTAERRDLEFVSLTLDRVDPFDRPRASLIQDPGEILDAWIDLHSRVTYAAFYQAPQWCAAWVAACAAAGRPEDVRIIAVYDFGRLVLIWPLAVRRLGPFSVLHALAEPATQYCDLLVEHSSKAADWIGIAWALVLAQPGVDLVHLRNVREGSELQRYGAHWLDGHRVATGVAPYLNLCASADGSRRQRSGRSVNALRRHLKQLSKRGPVVFETVPPSGQIAALKLALALKHDWSKARGVRSAGYEHPANEATLLTLASSGHFVMRQIRVGGKVAAIEIGATEKGHYYSMIQSYDASFSAHGPGRILLWRLFEDGDPEITTFDFLPPAQPHKTEWAAEAVPVHTYGVATSLKGHLVLGYFQHLKPRLKALYLKAPRFLQQVARDPRRALLDAANGVRGKLQFRFKSVQLTLDQTGGDGDGASRIAGVPHGSVTEPQG
ncbi:GNAT family N-acetyltransferase [Lichenihabitans sp. PAMC28606]|uniref:GNAT family N-acetyltransferase n=1 Tax=Lichenihabitans sp. PAMC28606 TaxID=2880932 RepID=UPI001D09B2E9|nr:GNAT family N-acetyltransferase [Lichenihabitans sp. PAMC28606]UDL93797.1 GNAT family N-acetyltransferase [Lichenihabitans sp. PAMC28606]